MYKVVIDPGHGGWDCGAVGQTGTQEKHIALAVALRVKELLAPVVDVQLTRDKDIALGANESADLTARARIANSCGADCFVSIHCNSATNREAKGTETYYFGYSAIGEILAGAIHKRLIPALELSDRGVKTANFAVLRQTNMPACLVELGFLSNKAEEAVLNTEEFQKKAAWAIANGVVDYLELNWPISLDGGMSGFEEQWKMEIVKKAEEAGIIDQGKHRPDDAAEKWFVLAVIMNAMEKGAK